MKQTEKQLKQIEFRFFLVQTEIFFCLFRGHHSRKVSMRVYLKRSLYIIIKNKLNHQNSCIFFLICFTYGRQFILFEQKLSELSYYVMFALLKGQCHEIFCFWFFSSISFPPAPEYPIRTISNFFENSRR